MPTWKLSTKSTNPTRRLTVFTAQDRAGVGVHGRAMGAANGIAARGSVGSLAVTDLAFAADECPAVCVAAPKGS